MGTSAPVNISIQVSMPSLSAKQCSHSLIHKIEGAAWRQSVRCSTEYVVLYVSASLLLKLSVNVDSQTGKFIGLARGQGACYGLCGRQARNSVYKQFSEIIFQYQRVCH